MNLKEQRELKAEILENLDNILNVADQENRDLTEDEDKEYKSLENDLSKAEGNIHRLETQEERKKKLAEERMKENEKVAAASAGGSASAGEEREINEIKEKFSFFDAYSQLRKGKNFDGVVNEMHQEAIKESRNAGYEISGVGVPSKMVEMRADVDQATSAIAGTDVGTYVEALRQSAVFSQVIPSSNILQGLTSDVNIQDVNKQATAWASAENSQAADGGTNLSKVTLSPIRLTSKINVSQKLGAQNGAIVMNALMADLGRDAANKIDAALFATADVTNAIPSIGGAAGLTFTEAATYAAPSATVNGTIYDDVLAAIQELADNDALQGATAIVANTKVLSDLVKSPQVLSVSGAVGSAQFGAPSIFNINGIPVYLTTSTTSSGTTSADMIGGDFSRQYVGFFGGVDMMVNPYIRAEFAQDQIVFHRWLDGATVQGEAFVKATSLLS